MARVESGGLPREVREQYGVAIERDIASRSNLQEPGEVIDRFAYEYLVLLQGLQELITYARNISRRGQQTFLWVGEGTLTAVGQFVKAGWMRGFKVIATTLDTSICLPVKGVTVMACGAERFRHGRVRIPDLSAVAMVSVCSIQYSARPDLLVEEARRVLTSGGVFKMVVVPTADDPFADKEIGVWKEALRGSGFDFWPGVGGPNFAQLVAVKMPAEVTAETLILDDAKTMGAQIDFFRAQREPGY